MFARCKESASAIISTLTERAKHNLKKRIKYGCYWGIALGGVGGVITGFCHSNPDSTQIVEIIKQATQLGCSGEAINHSINHGPRFPYDIKWSCPGTSQQEQVQTEYDSARNTYMDEENHRYVVAFKAYAPFVMPISIAVGFVGGFLWGKAPEKTSRTVPLMAEHKATAASDSSSDSSEEGTYKAPEIIIILSDNPSRFEFAGGAGSTQVEQEMSAVATVVAIPAAESKLTP